ncbi:hypothetical protein EDB89DRAFT_2133707 [Lactarius sanguifluus]|nr:hypothetical protein EDB89DRAFT_2133707 [Lactarius sanguifluus]
MSEQQVDAEPNIALCGLEPGTWPGNPILFLQGDDSLKDPPLISLDHKEALAAFHTNNFDHTAVGHPPMLSRMYIGITMIRTAPHFYEITITQALDDAVTLAQFPAEETIVQCFVPPVPNRADSCVRVFSHLITSMSASNALRH